MREIKFRIWDGNGFIYNGVTPFELIQNAVYDTTVMFSLQKKCIWQQYTGLKDINGKEIYEGDILKVQIPSLNIQTSEVIFYEGRFDFKSIAVTRLSDYVEYCEIIGNIYD